MCHRSVGLVARILEAQGIPTVSLGVVRSMIDGTPAPRNVFVPFRLGQVLGEPGNVAQQQAVLRAALGAVTRVAEPGGLLELPFRWKRGTYPVPVGMAGQPPPRVDA
jgi:D-proline reductase (dithiol) PrdB